MQTKDKMCWRAVVSVCFGLWFSPLFAQTNLPPGWRLPTQKEMTDEARNNSPTRHVRAVADFNADGVQDTALLLKSTRISGEALWVKLSDVSGTFKWIKLSEIAWGKAHPSVDLAMGIDVLKPGVHPYACFENAPDCNFGPYSERPKLKLKSPSLEYFKLDGAASLFFWSTKYKRFMRVWLSD
jgi:hypothetical protein